MAFVGQQYNINQCTCILYVLRHSKSRLGVKKYTCNGKFNPLINIHLVSSLMTNNYMIKFSERNYFTKTIFRTI